MAHGKLLAISDLHVGYPENRLVVEGLRSTNDQDWLIIAGDIGELVPDIEWAVRLLGERFAKVVWTPGNHELWTPPEARRVPEPSGETTVSVTPSASCSISMTSWPSRTSTPSSTARSRSSCSLRHCGTIKS
ncbi:Calcineurin-like phosphoesterase [Streptomyces sp. ADI95-17]|nr:Calcineurin-like phosphoesterase [Streptomyces sp. ADI95-17]